VQSEMDGLVTSELLKKPCLHPRCESETEGTLPASKTSYIVGVRCSISAPLSRSRGGESVSC